MKGWSLLAAAIAAASSGPAWAADARGPYASTYAPMRQEAVLIRGATVLDGKGGEAANTDLFISGGKIAAIGQGLPVPQDDVRVIEAAGKYVTPGIIDMHSHLGVYPSPQVDSTSDGNEAVRPATPDVWAEHSVWPQDPGFARALAGGVTTLMVLPGSANLFGGRTVTLKNVPSRTVQGMKFPDAPHGLKMACGENPKRVYGEEGGPATRMGNFAGYRAQWAKAAEYRQKWDLYETKKADYDKAKRKKGEAPEAPERDLALDTLADVLRGEILVQMHCYRADEMALILDLAEEFDYRVASFHHATESYKIADLLKEKDICSAMWADWWGFKLESWDGVRENIPLVHTAGACAVVHSDSAIGIQRLNQEAAKALADGRAMGLEISKGEAWRWVSSNPAKAIGVGDRTGDLTPGKAADVVIWSADPFSVYAKAEKVYIDGALVFDRADPNRRPVSDFEIAAPAAGDRP